jgi:anti-sigma factor RsiW
MTETLQAGHLSPEQWNALVDGELSTGEVHAAEEHLAECHMCALRVLEATRLKAATASAGQQFAVPPEALARLTLQLRPQEQAKKAAPILSFPAMRWMAVAACLLLAMTLTWRLLGREANEQSAELLDQHLAAISSGTEPEVISSDRHTVKPWFQGKLPFSFNLPEVLPADTTLKGGDLAYVGGRPAAMLLFTVHKHEVSVFLTQRSGPFTLPHRSSARSGFSIHYATTQELQIIGVSDLNSSELSQLVLALAEAQSGR